MVSSAQAQFTYSQSGNGGWNNSPSTSWSPAGPPAGIDVVADLTNNISSNASVSLNGSFTVGTLNIGDSGSGTDSQFNIIPGSGGTLTFDVSSSNAAINLVNATGATNSITTLVALNDSLDIGSANVTSNFSMTNVISGLSGAGINKSGNFTLILSGSNTFDGGVTLNGGRLDINNAGSGGTSSAFGTGTLVIGASGVSINNSSVGAITLSTNNAQTWGGDFTFVGTKDLNLGIGAVDMTGGSRTITTTAGTLTVGGAITGGANTLTKDGVGILVLGSTSNTFGAVTLTGGELRIAGTGSINNNVVTVGAGTILGVSADFDPTSLINAASSGILAIDTTGFTQALNMASIGNGSMYLGSVTGGSYTGGSLAASGSTYRLGGGGGTLTFSAANLLTGANDVLTGGNVTFGASQDYTGATKISSGTLQLNNTGYISGSTSITIAAGATLRGPNNSGSNYINNSSASLTVDGNLIGEVGGTSTSFTVGSLSGAATGMITLGRQTNSRNALVVNQTVDGEYAGIIRNNLINSGAAKLTKNGNATLTLSGDNIYGGVTTANAGTLKLGHNNALGFGAYILSTDNNGLQNTTVINPTATLDLNGKTVNEPILISAASLINSDTVTTAILDNGVAIINITSGPSGAVTITGGGGSGAVATTIGFPGNNAGGVRMTAAGSGYTSAPTVTFASGGGTVTAILSSLTLSGTTNQIGGAGNMTINAAMRGTGGGFTKIGNGLLTLSGSNTYTGDTTVTAGTLAVTGSMAFVPLAGGATNKITGAGTATLNGTFNLDLSGAGSAAQTWTLVDVAHTGSLTAITSSPALTFTNSSGVWTAPDGGGNTWTYTESSGVLALSAGGALSYAAWTASKFTSPADDAISGPTKDPDGDSMNNLLEFLVGTEPKTAEQGKGPVYTTPGNVPTLTLDCSSDALAQVTSVLGKSSTDLVTWPDSMPLFSSTPDSPSTGRTTLVFKDSAPLGGTKRFYRIEIIAP